MLTTSRVRKADAGDEAEILAMCRDMHRENGMFTMDDGRVRDIIRRAFNKQGAVIGVIAGVLVRGSALGAEAIGWCARALHTGSLHAYVYWFLFGAVTLWAFAAGVLTF